MSCPLACSERVFNCAGLFKIQILKQHMAACSQQQFPKVKTLQVLYIKELWNQSSVKQVSRETGLLEHCLFQCETSKLLSITRNVQSSRCLRRHTWKTHSGTEAKCREYTQFIYSFWWSAYVCVGGRWWHLSITDSTAVKTWQEEKERRRERRGEKQKWREGVREEKDKERRVKAMSEGGREKRWHKKTDWEI